MRISLRHPARIVVVAAILATAVTATSAWAHVTITSRSPKAGSTVSKSLRSVKITFSGPVRSGTLKVYKISNGQKVSIGTGGRDPRNIRRLTARLKTGLKRGRYRAKWTLVAADGHRQHGSYIFKLR